MFRSRACNPPPMTKCIWTSYGYHVVYLYNHFRLTKSKVVRTLPIYWYNLYLVTWGAAHIKKMTLSWKTSWNVWIWIWTNVNVPVCIRLCTLCPSFNIIQKYISGDHMLTSSCIFSVVTSSTFVSDIYGLIRRILCLICVAPYCNVTVPLDQHYVIKNETLYGASYFYAELLVSITLSPTL